MPVYFTSWQIINHQVLYAAPTSLFNFLQDPLSQTKGEAKKDYERRSTESQEFRNSNMLSEINRNLAA